MATRDSKQPTASSPADANTTVASSTGTSSLPLAIKEDDKIPLFLIKLWNIVEDPSYYDVIRWDDSGYSFHILDPYSFCRNVLPQYFKHNNLNSLIRQLNMYGFRKMTPIERTSLARAESDQDHLEFSHPCFVRDHPDLLGQIKRKTTTTRRDEPNLNQNHDISTILEEVRLLRERQKTMEDRINDLTGENQNLWQQMSSMRAAHVKQQQIVNKLVQFLVTLVQPKRLAKRHMLAINESSSPKRFRTSNGANEMFGGSSSAGESSSGKQMLPTTSQNNTHEVLDRLMRDISSSNYDLTIGGGNAASPNNGPIISDVTDELDLLSTNQNDFLNIPDASVSMGAQPSAPVYDGVTQHQQPQMRPTQNVYGYPNRVPARITMRPQQQQQQQQQQQLQQPPQHVPLNHGQVPSSSHLPTMNMQPQHSGSSVLGRNVDDNAGSALSSTDQALGFTSDDFAHYLSGVDQGIDNCRDLIGDQWNAFDLDNFMDGGTNDLSPTDGWNVNPGLGSMESTHPNYIFDNTIGNNDPNISPVATSSFTAPSIPAGSTRVRTGQPIAPNLYPAQKR